MTEPLVTTGLVVGLMVWLGVAALAGFLVRHASGRTLLGLLSTVVLFVLPIWDLPFGLLMYKRYVNELGGMRIFRTVEADGYLQSPSHTIDFIVQTLRIARGRGGGQAFPYSYYEGFLSRGS